MPITEHDKPVFKLICSNDDCTADNWTALDEDGYTKFFDSQAHAREWGGLADAAEARDRREQADDIAAAVTDALMEG
jgi:hypothetical protein